MAKIRIMATLGRLLAWWLFAAMAADAVADESLHGPQSASCADETVNCLNGEHASRQFGQPRHPRYWPGKAAA